MNHLKVFAEVAECGKMSLAAEHLYLSQPTVSQIISDLEKHYGMRLFERYPRRLDITHAGTVLLGRAKPLLEQFRQLEDEMMALSSSGPIRVGATVTVGTCIIHDIVSRYERLRPGSCVRLTINNTRHIEDMLVGNELDIAVVEGTIEKHEVVSEPIMADYLVVICSPGHPLAGKQHVTPKELGAQRFVLREQGSGTRALFENFMRSEGCPVNIRIECSDEDTIRRFVSDSSDLSVTSIRLVETELEQKRLRVLHIRDHIISRNFSLIYLKNKFLTDDIKSFITICRGYKEADLSKLLRDAF